MPRYELQQKRKQERQVWRELPEGSRVVIYGRHSPGEAQTIDSQAEAMRRWVESRQWFLVREFYDEGIEGSRSDRPAFQEMLRFLHQEPRPADGVITWNTMRFGRDQLDSQFFKADLRRRGYAVLGKEDGIEQSPLAPVLESMLEWKAQQDLAVIGADTKRGLEYLARHGYWPGGALPMGYIGEKELIGHRKNGEPRFGTRVRKDPALAERVQRAWEMRLAGASYREIHEEVRFYHSAKCYSTFFSNPLYTGVLEYGGRRYPEDWREGSRFCEPYVSVDHIDELRAKAKQWTERRGTGPDRHPRNVASPFLLSGLIVCGWCLQRGIEVTVAGWQDSRNPRVRCYRCGRKQRVKGSACTLRSVTCDLLDRTIVECIRGEIFTPEYIRSEVARANAQLAEQQGSSKRAVQMAEQAEATARKALDNLASFIAANGANPVIEERYRVADREWRSATARLTAARAERRATRPLQVGETEATAYAHDSAEHMQEGDIRLRRQFLAAFIKRIVLYDTEGTVELVEQPALDALRSISTPDLQNTRGVAPRPRRHYAPRLVHGRKANIPMDGTPSGIRTRDLHLERVMS
jgi:DNA invertase Pin-like site-specific DNA recombinase